MDRRSPPPCQVSPHRCNVSPLRGEKPQNRPMSKLNTGRFALRAMLPVIMTNRKSYTGFPTSHQPRFYAASNFLKMGIKYVNLSYLRQFRQYTTKSVAKFHYIKTVSGKVVSQSIAFRVVSICWHGDDHFPLKSWLKLTHLLLKVASFDTFCLLALQILCWPNSILTC